MAHYPLFRTAIGSFLLLELVCLTPAFHVFFGSVYLGGPLRGSRALRALSYTTWLLSAVALITGQRTMAGAIGMFAVCRWLFVDSRWRGIFFGASAAGYVNYFVTFAVLLFEVAIAVDPAGRLFQDVVFVVRVQFAFVLLCGGLYKLLTGYLRGEGIEYGLVNPAWSYFHARLRRVEPGSALWRSLDIVGSFGEAGAGVLMLVPHPAARAVGEIFTIALFAGIAVTIRVGRLPVMMILTAVFLLRIPDAVAVAPGAPPPSSLAAALHHALYIYVALVVVVKITQYLNHFYYRPVIEPVQTIVTLANELVPIPMMRVFMPDFTNFFVRIWSIDARTGVEKTILHESTTYSYGHWGDLKRKLRYLYVGESITLASIFCSLKIFKPSWEQFQKEVLAYASTVVLPGDEAVKMQYVALEKGEGCFIYRAACDFHVDLRKQVVREEPIAGSEVHRTKSRYSPNRERLGFGWHWSLRTAGRKERLPWLLRGFANEGTEPPAEPPLQT